MNLNKIRNVLGNIKGYLDTAVSSAGGIDAFDIAKVPGKDIFPGDVQIFGFVVASKTPGVRPVDLLNLCYEINIYESIISPVIFGNAKIRDSENVLRDVLKGDVYIKIKFATPGRQQVNYVFRVLNNTDVLQGINDRVTEYTLEFASPGYEQNLKGAVNPPVFENLTFKQIVEQIVKDRFNPNGLHICDDTVAHFEAGGPGSKTSFTNKTPFEAIDYCRQAAFSAQYNYSPYLFFENQNGYNFVTLASLMARAKEGINEEKVFKFAKFDKDDFSKVRFYNIMAYNNVVNADISMLAERGGLNASMTVENFKTGNIFTVDLTDVAGVNQAQSFGGMDNKPGSFTSQTQANIFGKINKDTPQLKLFTSKTGPDWFLRDWAKKQVAAHAFVAYVLQHVTLIHIYGHSNITAGDGVTCWFQYTGDSDDKNLKVKDGPITGNYLVSKVRHRIFITDRPGYSQSLELIKAGWNTDLDKV